MFLKNRYSQIKAHEESLYGLIKIVLINTPLDYYESGSQPKYDTLYPFGLLALAQISHKMSISTLIIDGEASRLSVDEIISLANDLNPEIVGINLLSPSIDISATICKGIKSEKRILIGGGPHATIEPEDCFDRIPEIDYLFCGEATISWGQFLEQYRKQGHQGITDINGMMSRSSKRKTLGKRSESIDEFLSVDRRLTVFPFHDKNGLKETSITASIGCRENCRYCAGRVLSGGVVRYRSISSLVDEIQYCVTQFGVTAIHFADDNFLQSVQYLKSFSDELKRRALSIKWRSFSRVDSLSKEIADLAKESGCYRLTFGIESGNLRTLERMGKGHSVEDAYKAVEICKTAGIETKSFFMLGYPDETEAEILDTIKFSLQSSLDWAYFYLVRAFPGTALFRELLRLRFTRADLLQYRYWVPDLDKNITESQKRYRKLVEENDIFNADSILKYNIAHKKSINLHLSNDRLIELMADAYCQFYYRKEFFEQQMKNKLNFWRTNG
ncbi:MAG TPA: B12-binding domain-containing radical SAM protein [Brevefilum fermentans]|jgi:anaerobic magnesium-protoporphyrin IX monomethyl ester cyclase|nr:B12-binding domain-containing radical SAM protein [Chloroflexota bacterium]HQA29530.1 B12-binding domain-containing radical SAM protein [Brevefilum fermentans]